MARSGVDLSHEELLDVLWLAGSLPRDIAPLARAGVPASRPGQPDPGHRSPSPIPQGSAPAAGPSALAPPEDPQPDHPIHAASETNESGVRYLTPRRAFAVRAPDSRVLGARGLRLGKSLRPLRQRFPDPRRQELDIAQTVTAMAETGLPETVTRPARTRWLSLVLLVDDGVSMVLWQRLAAEVRTLMERAGAFRDVRIHGLDTRSPRAPLLSARPFQGRGPYQSPTSVSDPTGDTLILVVSDGVGEAWWDGRMRQAMEFWARRGPTAIVHALPTRLWASSGITAQRWQVTSHRRGGPTTVWHLNDPVLPPDLVSFDSVPVPVLEPSPTAIADWARLVASPGTTTLLPVWHSVEPLEDHHFTDTRHGDEAQAVLRFRDAASPEAYRLAGHLAAVAPLTPPVMRLIQDAVGAPTDSGHIVEVFLGGLMRQVKADGLPRLPHHQLFDFTEVARRILLGAVSPTELLRTTQAVAGFMEAAAGRAPHFPAWVGHPDGSAVIGEAGRSFGWLKERLLRRLGVPPPSTVPTDTSPTRPSELAAADLGGAAGAPEAQPADVPPGWSPLLPRDPHRLGPYRLFARNDRGWVNMVMYLALNEAGETVTVRAPAPLYSLAPGEARELITTEADCLARMSGVHAPRLLRSRTDDTEEPPWLAATFVRRRDDDRGSGPAPNLRAAIRERKRPVGNGLFWRVGRDLARAVSRAHSLGLAHGALVPKTVLVTDHDVQLIGWITATRDGVHSDYRRLFPRGETCFQAPDDIAGPTRESDMYSVGALLLACATGRWTDLAADAELRQALEELEVEAPIAEALWRCLDPSPADRPTADELVEVFTEVLGDPADARDEDGLVAITVRRYRELARQDPDAYRFDLARALNNLSNRLSESGRSEEALAAITEAVDLYREAAPLNPTSVRSDLARYLSNLSVRLGDVGRSEEALAAITEAVTFYRDSVSENLDVSRADLATTLNNMSNRLSESGRSEEALAAITEAVDLYREAAPLNPTDGRPGLARALNNLSNRLSESGRSEEALAAITEAVDLYREAAPLNPTDGRPGLASSLNNLAVRLGERGRREEALAAVAEAVEIRRHLAEVRPELHEADLQQSLKVSSWLRKGGGRASAGS
ncbi:SAV_2336 N-terminal domain-related protein [Streptomyces sp. NPDC048171]|uniref:SAV_2336 N-terminal domain-related protein n=1 Tax=Streptomyces sp. NPDC048171 TaxID=3365504 RepID=UPI0037219977